jgi:hypothetical protein
MSEGTPPPTFATNPAAAQRRALMEQALGAMWPAAGIGAGLAGFKALRGLTTDLFREAPRLPIRRTVIRFPVRSQRADDEDAEGAALKAAAVGFAKLAAEDDAPLIRPISEALTTASGGGPTPAWGRSMLWPDGATSWRHAPATWPVATLAALGGGHLAYTLADKLFRGARRVGRKSEVEEARQDFQDAMVGKSAATAVIDATRDMDTRKQALYGELIGGGLAASALAAYLAGHSAYNFSAKNSPESAVRKALRQREEELFEMRPAPIVVVPEAQRPRKPRMTLEDYRRRLQAHLGQLPRADGSAHEAPKEASDIGGAVLRERARLDARRAAWQRVIAGMHGQKPETPAKAPAAPAGPPSLGQVATP